MNIAPTNSTPDSSESSAHLGFVLLISSVAAIGGLLFGYDSGCINGTVEALKTAFGSSDVASGFNVASILLGCAVGAFLAGRIADKFGRRAALFAAAVLFALGAWGAGAAFNSAVFIVARLIGGFAVGAASVIAPAYISEVSPTAYRGRLASLQQLGIVLGLFLAFLANYLIARAAGSANSRFWFDFPAWRWMFWVQLIPISFFFLGLFLIPESPRYLVSAGDLAGARNVLMMVSDASTVEGKIVEIQKTLKVDHRPSLRDLYHSVTGKMHPIVWVGLSIAALQQLVGINVVFYYGEILWRAAGFSEGDALKINVIGGVINVASTLIAIALVDKWGRKPLLITGSIGMAITLGLLAVIFGTAHVAAGGALQLSAKAGLTALISANAYIVAFGMSWGPVMWVLLGEMFPNQMRGAALAVAGLSQWGTNFLVTMTFPLMLRSIGLGGAYGLYAGFALISLFVVRAIVPETKGRTLEQM
ncbi:MAG: sugar porter family MFS transporter [Chthoniobacterales bacterium]|nr:sugar porter family MFS transporter [Chthoniobacterales bacterium]